MISYADFAVSLKFLWHVSPFLSIEVKDQEHCHVWFYGALSSFHLYKEGWKAGNASEDDERDVIL